jgi:hypothetical protein
MAHRLSAATALGSALASAALVALVASPASAVRAPATRAGVPRGTAVLVRVNPGNSIVASVNAAAAKVQLGSVQAVGFSPDCSPMSGRVVVCRDPALTRAAATKRGPGWCVVSTDPRLGGGQPAVRELTHALRACVTR